VPIDANVAIGAELPAIEFSWTTGDVLLYHLGLGAGADPMNPRELSYLVDDRPQVLPTFGSVAATFHATEPPQVYDPGVDIELSKVLHASEHVTVQGACRRQAAPAAPAASSKSGSRARPPSSSPTRK
jgi:hypothetical protein